ncbi:hypothetical protein [Paenibacillus rhizophilus]|uniref:Uncharacterized protein n=1 Tax=Paenibacillus rhizophilus TaxID=1850366 RepID=A0A3N9P3S8_9BACL|nr:hypothetical protein [Paenibacillus rhizophilus]RQW10399.1 hypothetical protein EH198_16415 [Paenibacillus rhizophilus]
MKYRVWNVINLPAEPARIPVDTPKQGIVLIHKMSHEQLERPEIETNAFGLEYFDEEDKKWWEWEDADGYGVTDYEALSDTLVMRDDGEQMD